MSALEVVRPDMTNRVITDGKHLKLRSTAFRVKGATYGGFAAREDGARFPDPPRIDSDFRAIARAGLNTVRVYDLPPADLLDVAATNDLKVIVGLDYHDWRMEPDPGRAGRRRILDAGTRAVNEAMEMCAGRPEVLAIAVGNEIPVDLVRFHGAGSAAATLSQFIAQVHQADREMLATYVNFPTTEFLEVDGQDFVCFNVFLEEAAAFRRYVRHLQVVARDLPLVLTEVGLAADLHGESAQAELLDGQLRIIDETGLAGATVYAWTDDWAVDDKHVEGWGFGITTVDRTPKPALEAVARWGARSIQDLRDEWPQVSVIVCAYNEERTLNECLTSLEACVYPNLEVIVCDDGSTDRTPEIAHRFPFRVLGLPHGGLSRARNAGLEASSGDIVAYLDADAACHPEWLFHLAMSLEEPNVVATGGPNLPHLDAGLVERAVADSPGSPMEVLISYDRAEHVPGCNMAFRREHLVAIGGFDPVYTSAGDDVDVCWTLLDEGHEIGFAPAAQVYHHRRNTIKGYLRQQRGYGRAEKLLSGPHRYRFNRLGQARWSGFVYGRSRLLPSLFKPVVYTGNMGSASFQPITHRRAEFVGSWATALLPLTIPLMVLGMVLPPLSLWWLALPGGLGATAGLYGAGVGAALRVDKRESHPMVLRMLVGLLHVLQPPVRAWGRLIGTRAEGQHQIPAWVGDRMTWLVDLKRAFESEGCRVRAGSPGKHWDLEAVLGPMIAARMTTAVVWRWDPRYRTAYQPRPLALALGATAVLALVVGSELGWYLVGLSILWPVVEMVFLRRRVGRAISRTIRGLTAGAQMVRPRRRGQDGEADSFGVRPIPDPKAKGKAKGKAKETNAESLKERGSNVSTSDLRLLRRSFFEARPYRLHIAALFGLSLLSTPLALLGPVPLAVAVDSALGSEPLPAYLQPLVPASIEQSPNGILLVAATLLVLVALITGLQSLLTSVLRTYTGERLTLQFQGKLLDHVQRLSFAFHDSRGTADSIYRIQYDASSIQSIAVGSLIPFITAGITLVSMLFIILRIDWQLALIALAVSPFLFGYTKSYRTRMRPRYKQVKRLESSALKVVQEVLTSFRVVKAFGREDDEKQRFVDKSTEGVDARIELTIGEGAYGLLVSVTTAVGTAVVLYMGIRGVQVGTLTLGSLLLVLSYVGQLYGPLKTISSRAASLQRQLASAERAFDLMDEVPDVREEPNARHVERAAGQLELKNVWFSYDGETDVLRDISLVIPQGSTVGILGKTGAGKTTLVSLLTRFYDPRTGSILLDGVELRDYNLRDLRAQFTIMLQEPVLFSTSIAENVAYARPGASMDEIVQATETAGGHEFVSNLPDGYDTVVGERGMRLSGGERQRISLARAFLKDAPILVLDEPTSSVDTGTEREILEAMKRLMEGRTTLMIAHRLGTLDGCDILLQLDDGHARLRTDLQVITRVDRADRPDSATTGSRRA